MKLWTHWGPRQLPQGHRRSRRTAGWSAWEWRSRHTARPLADQYPSESPEGRKQGSYKEMSSILAYQKRPRIWAQMRGGGGVAGSQPISTALHRSPNKLWRSNLIFDLWQKGTVGICIWCWSKNINFNPDLKSNFWTITVVLNEFLPKLPVRDIRFFELEFESDISVPFVVGKRVGFCPQRTGPSCKKVQAQSDQARCLVIFFYLSNWVFDRSHILVTNKLDLHFSLRIKKG